MNKYIKLAVCLITVAFCFTSCGNFDEINTDPDVPTRVTAAMLASGGIKSMLGSPGANGSRARSECLFRSRSVYQSL